MLVGDLPSLAEPEGKTRDIVGRAIGMGGWFPVAEDRLHLLEGHTGAEHGGGGRMPTDVRAQGGGDAGASSELGNELAGAFTGEPPAAGTGEKRTVDPIGGNRFESVEDLAGDWDSGGMPPFASDLEDRDTGVCTQVSDVGAAGFGHSEADDHEHRDEGIRGSGVVLGCADDRLGFFQVEAETLAVAASRPSGVSGDVGRDGAFDRAVVEEAGEGGRFASDAGGFETGLSEMVEPGLD